MSIFGRIATVEGREGDEPKVSGNRDAFGKITDGVTCTDNGGGDLDGGDVGKVAGKMAVPVRANCAIDVGAVDEEG